MAYDDIKVEIFTKFLYPGMILKGDGFDESGKKVIDKETPIEQELINRLKLMGVQTITYSRERLKLKKDIKDSMISEAHIEKAINIVGDLEHALRAHETDLPIKEVDAVVSDFVADIKENGDACLNLLDLAEMDDYTYTHSVNVSTLCIALGLALNLEEDKVINVGTAGLLHDIGKTLIDIDIINKPGKLNEEEWAIMRNHPTYSYQILKAQNRFGPAVLNGVLLHHENYNGKGYPLGITAEKSNIYAQIISVCDVFDAITSKRSYKDAATYSEAFTHIMDNTGTKFHPKISQVFLKDLIKKINEEPLYPIDSYVLMNTGEIAYVVDHRQSPYSLRPIVNIFFNPNKPEKFLKFVQQIDLEQDYNRTVVKRINDKRYVEKFNQQLGREGI